MADRLAWLRERRRVGEERMDTLFAPGYDAHWGEIFPAHRAMIGRFLSLCPPNPRVLDAACGTGKYWELLLEHGCSIVGIDHSGEMLRTANAKFPQVPTEHRGLQDLSFHHEFDGVICVDAMELVSPEDWPQVLGNLVRALKDDGLCYFTVELTSDAENQEAYDRGKELGLPVIWGEHAHEGGYHYYPALDRVRDWVRTSGLLIAEEAEDDVYHHFLTRNGMRPDS